jgi:hypothetical protein
MAMKVCDDCKGTDQVETYQYPTANDATEDLCYDCAIKGGFCVGCGWFMAGIESFDFSPVKGYCVECRSEFERDEYCDDDDYDGDLPDEAYMEIVD